MNYSDAKSPRWANSEKTIIDVDVNFGAIAEDYVPFTADLNDPAPHGVELYNRALAGDFGAIADYVAPPDITGEDAMLRLREQRDKRLAETDFWALSDTATMTSGQSAYRQALRDLPTNSPDAILRWSNDEPNLGYNVWVNVTWPSVGE